MVIKLDLYIYIATIIGLFIFLFLFRKEIGFFIRRLRELNFSGKGVDVSIKTDQENTLSLSPKCDISSIENASYKMAEKKLPQKLYSSLIGRKDEADEILDRLANIKEARIIGIHGIGGIGKTALARYIADEVINNNIFCTAYWSTAKRISFEPDEESLSGSFKVNYESILVDLIKWLGVFDDLKGVKDLSKKENKIKEILDAIPCLIVIDNIETANIDQNELTVKLKKILNKSRCILTSRVKWDNKLEIFTKKLNGLSIKDSMLLVKSIAKTKGIDRVDNVDMEIFLPLLKIIGGSPLALKLLSGLLSSYDIDFLIHSFKNPSVKDIEEMYNYLYISAWKSLTDNEKKILVSFIQFDLDIGANAIKLRNINSIKEHEFIISIDKLIKMSLIEVCGDTISTRYILHPLTHSFLSREVLKN